MILFWTIGNFIFFHLGKFLNFSFHFFLLLVKYKILNFIINKEKNFFSHSQFDFWERIEQPTMKIFEILFSLQNYVMLCNTNWTDRKKLSEILQLVMFHVCEMVEKIWFWLALFFTRKKTLFFSFQIESSENHQPSDICHHFFAGRWYSKQE